MKDLTVEAINELRCNARNVVRELGLLNDAYFDIGVTLAERHLLIELSACSPVIQGTVAERLLLDKSTVSRLISGAVKKGYIECRPGEQDKRKRFLTITEKGDRTLKMFEPIAFNQTKEALSGLSEEEIETVRKGIELYAKGLKQSRLQSSSGKKEPISKSEIGKSTIESLTEIYEELNGMGYTLGLFNKSDEEELYIIFREVVDSGSQFPYECNSIEEFRRRFFVPQGQVYVCRSSEGKIIGGFYLKANDTGRSGHIANAAYMIASSYRGKGIGSLLIKASLQFAKDLGFHAMQFNMVLSQNTSAIRLYQRLGFAIVGTIPQAVRNSDGTFQDGFIMYYSLFRITQ